MTFSFRSALVIALACVSFSVSAADKPNELTDAEKKAGWKLLWDGKTLNGWRSYMKPAPPTKGWDIADGVLTHVKDGKGGDIITDQTFDNFEFSWEWRQPAKSNNGIKYFITEERKVAVGHEYQMIDESLVHGDAKSSTAAFYLVVEPKADKKIKPFGEWNHSKVIVHGDHVEHWLNGEKVVEYECGSPAVLEQVAKTKFKSTPGFGNKLKGHLMLTSHNDETSFRNVKIRELPAK